MISLAVAAGLLAFANGPILVANGEEGMLVMGTTSERRVVVLVKADTMLAVSGPRLGSATAVFARVGRAFPATVDGQSPSLPDVRPRGDRLKAVVAWVNQELGVSETPQRVEPTWLPAGSFRPEAYLAPGDLVQSAEGRETTALRFDPEAGPLEWQARRQRALDEARERDPSAPIARAVAAAGADRVALIVFGASWSEPYRTFEAQLNSPRLAGVLARRAEVLTVNCRDRGRNTPGAEAFLRALHPSGPGSLPAWAVFDGSGRVLATSVGLREGRVENYGGPTTPEAKEYWSRQLGRVLPRMDRAALQAL
jgi:hypothetical protein